MCFVYYLSCPANNNNRNNVMSFLIRVASIPAACADLLDIRSVRYSQSVDSVASFGSGFDTLLQSFAFTTRSGCYLKHTWKAFNGTKAQRRGVEGCSRLVRNRKLARRTRITYSTISVECVISTPSISRHCRKRPWITGGGTLRASSPISVFSDRNIVIT